jgi:hypothetical protein
MKKATEHMKKYFVARVCGIGYTPYIEFNTDSREDAEQFAALMQRNDKEYEYFVLSLV